MMNIDDRYSATIWADERMYVDDASYRDFIAKRIQDEIANAMITVLYTNDAIVVIKGDSTTRKDDYTCGIYCRQDISIKKLVLCKNCKYHDDEEVGMVYCPNIVGGWVSEDFYCGNGEQKEVEE